jgi:hypothetical protein
MGGEPAGRPTPLPRGLALLRAFARRAAPAERCGVCGAPLDPRHDHLLDSRRGALRCACGACAVLLEGGEAARWRRVPPRVERLAPLRVDDGRWAALGVPIGLAFFVRRSEGAVIARYPSPGGAVEAVIPPGAWAALVAGSPALGTLAPEIEALLVRDRGGAMACWRVSIDRAYRLAGLVRRFWRGFSGGDDLQAELDRFFAALDEEASGHA